MQKTRALEKAAVLEAAVDDFVVLSQKANTAITESIEDEPELGRWAGSSFAMSSCMPRLKR
jgi:hypothetical protein